MKSIQYACWISRDYSWSILQQVASLQHISELFYTDSQYVAFYYNSLQQEQRQTLHVRNSSIWYVTDAIASTTIVSDVSTAIVSDVTNCFVVLSGKVVMSMHNHLKSNSCTTEYLTPNYAKHSHNNPPI
jgi:hypothetical protein